MFENPAPFHKVQEPSGRFGLAIFAMGLGWWLAVHSWVAVGPNLLRPTLEEPDDTYSYLCKAQTFSLWTKKPAAMRDLDLQTSRPTNDAKVSYQQWYVFGRTLYVYHPVYSMLAQSLMRLGVSPENSFCMLSLFGTILIGVGLGWLLKLTFGSGPAGLALTILGLIIFPGQGLHYLVPSNITLGFAIIVWTRLLATEGAAPWTMIVGTILCVAGHPVGCLYAGVAVFLATWMLLRSGRLFPPSFGIWGSLAFTSVLVVAAFQGHRMLGLERLAPLTDMTYAQGVAENLIAAWASVTRLIGSFHWVLFMAFAIMGMVSLAPTRRKIALRAGTLSLGLAGISLLHVLPHYPAEFFHRVWPVSAALLAGLVAQGIFGVMTELKRIKNESWAVNPLRLGLSVVVAGLMIDGAVWGFRETRRIFNHKAQKNNCALDVSQVRYIQEHLRPNEKVLYTNMTVLCYYLTHGANDLGAAYYAPREKTSLATDEEFANVRFATIVNPFHETTNRLPGPGLLLDRYDTVQLRLPPSVATSPLILRLKNTSRHASHVTVRSESDAEPLARLELPGYGEKDLEVPVKNRGSELLIASAGGTGATLSGLRIENSETHWPWGQGVEFVTRLKRDSWKVETYHFDLTESLPPSLRDRQLKVVDDQGTNVLVELMSK